MNLSAKESLIHHHLTRPIARKTRATTLVKPFKIESGLGQLQIGTDVLSVPAAYKPIFRL